MLNHWSLQYLRRQKRQRNYWPLFEYTRTCSGLLFENRDRVVFEHFRSSYFLYAGQYLNNQVFGVIVEYGRVPTSGSSKLAYRTMRKYDAEQRMRFFNDSKIDSLELNIFFLKEWRIPSYKNTSSKHRRIVCTYFVGMILQLGLLYSYEVIIRRYSTF